ATEQKTKAPGPVAQLQALCVITPRSGGSFKHPDGYLLRCTSWMEEIPLLPPFHFRLQMRVTGPGCDGQPQAPLPAPPAQRHQPREVPPRFRQQEHKQLLKRGQPLPPGLLALPPGLLALRPRDPAASECPVVAPPPPSATTAAAEHASSSSSSSSGASSGQPHTDCWDGEVCWEGRFSELTVAVAPGSGAWLTTVWYLRYRQTGAPELPPKSVQGAQYNSPLWGHQPANRSVSGTSLSNNPSGWDQPIIDQEETEALPSINYSLSRNSHGGCPLGTDPGSLASDSSNITASMATGANGQTGHFPAGHPSGKASSGPNPANHTGANMLSNQAAANRSWGSGPGSAHCPPQSSTGGDGKSDGPLGAGGRGWGCSSSTSNFNLNLNPNANPSAWPALGHEGAGTGGGSSGGGTNSPHLISAICPGAHWRSSEPQNLNTDGPNHTSKQEPPSPVRNMPGGWGGATMGMGPRGQSQPGAPQVNGEDSGTTWASGDSKTPTPSKEASGWDSGSNWGLGGGVGGGSGGWGTEQQSSGEWGKQGATEAPGGWDAPSSPPQDQQANSWGRAQSTTVPSEGSSDGAEGISRRTERPSRDEAPPAPPAPDVDPRLLCNTGWGQTPVRQHTSWDMIEKNRKAEKAAESWGSRPSTCSDIQGPANTNTAPPQRSDSMSKNDGPGPKGAPGWGGSMATTNQTSSGWGDQPSNKKNPSGPGGWGNNQPGGGPMNVPKHAGQGWGEEKSAGWEEPHNKMKPQGWGEQPKASHGWGNSGGNGGDWEPEEKKKSNSNPNASWEGEGGWKDNPRSWSKPAQGPGQSGSWSGSKPEPPGSATGWEEPSPPSIRRKMEIDDGTSAWGDPGAYNKAVNLWDRNNPGNHAPQNSGPPSGPMEPSMPHQAGPPPHSRAPAINQGWGEVQGSHAKPEGSWGDQAAPQVNMDNGTSAWGKSPGGWGDGGPDSYSRGNPPMGSASCKPAPKPMQDSWGGDVWNGGMSQENNSWSNAPKKGPQKMQGKIPGKQEETWMLNRLIKQLTDMGFPRGMGMGGHDYSNGLMNKALGGPRPPLLSKEPPMERRSPFMEKPPVPPLGSSQPGLRAQVPQILSPQVQAQLLQFAAKNIGLNPALLTSPINPQHMTLLNQLYQLQLAYQRLQIQQQMLQAQRNVSGPIRQQEQQVARTITNMQQQIQQHQRQLAQALLMKQQQPPPPPSHTGLHPGTVKSALDSFPGHPHASGLSDLQTKEPQSSPHAYSSYPLSGLNSNMNVNCMEVGSGLSMKEHSQPQSRLSQWTHPNSMDTLSGGSSPLEPSLAKHANLGPPGKPPQMEDSYSPYNLMSSSDSPTSPPDNWGPGKSSNDKIANGTNITWPPEFCPGVPWKGLQNIDPETDPNMTPGSVPNGPTINTNIQDVNRSSPTSSQTEALPPSTDWPVSSYSSSFSLSSPEMDDAGKLPDMKSTWSPGPISNREATGSLSHELWKVPQGPRGSAAPSRPPPGLTNGLSDEELLLTWNLESDTFTVDNSVMHRLQKQSPGSNALSITLSNLTAEDAGVYLCEYTAKGVETIKTRGHGSVLLLLDYSATDAANTGSSCDETNPSATVILVWLLAVITVLLLGILVVIVIVPKLRKKSNAGERRETSMAGRRHLACTLGLELLACTLGLELLACTLGLELLACPQAATQDDAHGGYGTSSLKGMPPPPMGHRPAMAHMGQGLPPAGLSMPARTAVPPAPSPHPAVCKPLFPIAGQAAGAALATQNAGPSPGPGSPGSFKPPSAVTSKPATLTTTTATSKLIHPDEDISLVSQYGGPPQGIPGYMSGGGIPPYGQPMVPPGYQGAPPRPPMGIRPPGGHY
ncbi:hypothetical protein NHX12_031200, partial [Muraenolepis orangiensis]